jgi:hypothetical protein
MHVSTDRKRMGRSSTQQPSAGRLHPVSRRVPATPLPAAPRACRQEVLQSTIDIPSALGKRAASRPLVSCSS